MNTKLKLIAGVAGLKLSVSALAGGDAPPAAASSSGSEIEQLKQQIEALDQKVRVLEREREIDHDDAAALTKAQPKIVIGSKGLSAVSADTNFVIQLHGVLQADSRTFFQDGGINGNDGFLLRRARQR